MGTGGCFIGSTAACVWSWPLTSTLKIYAAIPLLPILLYGIHRDNFTVSVTWKNFIFLVTLLNSVWFYRLSMSGYFTAKHFNAIIAISFCTLLAYFLATHFETYVFICHVHPCTRRGNFVTVVFESSLRPSLFCDVTGTSLATIRHFRTAYRGSQKSSTTCKPSPRNIPEQLTPELHLGWLDLTFSRQAWFQQERNGILWTPFRFSVFSWQ